MGADIEIPASASDERIWVRVDPVRRAEYLPHYWAGRISTTLSRRLRLIRRAYRVCC